MNYKKNYIKLKNNICFLLEPIKHNTIKSDVLSFLLLELYIIFITFVLGFKIIYLIVIFSFFIAFLLSYIYLKDRYNRGILKVDLSIYYIPEENELFKVKKSFYYDGSPKSYMVHNHTQKPNTILVKKDNILRYNGYMETNNKILYFFIDDSFYGESFIFNTNQLKKFLISKKDIRLKKLKKLGL